MLDQLAQHVAALSGAQLPQPAASIRRAHAGRARRAMLSVLRALRDDAGCQFEQLIDICGVDYPEREKRFDVVYHLLSPRKNQRLRIKCEVDERRPCRA